MLIDPALIGEGREDVGRGERVLKQWSLLFPLLPPPPGFGNDLTSL